jgi:hypothetical protein
VLQVYRSRFQVELYNRALPQLPLHRNRSKPLPLLTLLSPMLPNLYNKLQKPHHSLLPLLYRLFPLLARLLPP